MNCKEGDLAIVVTSYSGNEGRVVRCIKLIPTPNWFEDDVYWKTEGTLRGSDGREYPWARDNQLRPIRDNDGEDQTLTWVPKHEGVTT